jgi:16S rRNA (adenine1518-N6/adenine1519-N6)-dimethyltransferase
MRQKWGQNFLTDRTAAERIVGELGVGRGILTQFLVGKVKRLVGVEIDKELADFLRVKWAGREGFEIAHADALFWPLPDWPAESVDVVGNLPYSAANAILRRLLDWPAWRQMVVMVQKEVAHRMVAVPGGKTYGVLSLAVQTKSRPEILFDVSPSSFDPVPEVTSTVLRLSRLPSSPVANERIFFRVVKAAFAQRRKTLANALAGGMAVKKSLAEARLRETGIDPFRRAETVSLEEFERLSRLFDSPSPRSAKAESREGPR